MVSSLCGFVMPYVEVLILTSLFWLFVTRTITKMLILLSMLLMMNCFKICQYHLVITVVSILNKENLRFFYEKIICLD